MAEWSKEEKGKSSTILIGSYWAPQVCKKVYLFDKVQMKTNKKSIPVEAKSFQKQCKL